MNFRIFIVQIVVIFTKFEGASSRRNQNEKIIDKFNRCSEWLMLRNINQNEPWEKLSFMSTKSFFEMQHWAWKLSAMKPFISQLFHIRDKRNATLWRFELYCVIYYLFKRFQQNWSFLIDFDFETNLSSCKSRHAVMIGTIMKAPFNFIKGTRC